MVAIEQTFITIVDMIFIRQMVWLRVNLFELMYLGF